MPSEAELASGHAVRVSGRLDTAKETVMAHHLIPVRPVLPRNLKRILVAGAFAALAYLVFLFAGIPIGRYSSMHEASAVERGSHSGAQGSERARRAAPYETARAREAPPDFDYFPDHYQNQAREPAEQIATF